MYSQRASSLGQETDPRQRQESPPNRDAANPLALSALSVSGDQHRNTGLWKTQITAGHMICASGARCAGFKVCTSELKMNYK